MGVLFKHVIAQDNLKSLEINGDIKFYKDYRINFRFNFGEDIALIEKMHKSSRRYAKKILDDSDKFTLKKVAHDDIYSIELFSKMYHDTSLRLEFSEKYKFEFTNSGFTTIIKSIGVILTIMKTS